MANKKPSAAPSLGRQLSFASGATNALCNQLLAPHGLGLAQWAVLACLWRNGDLSIRALAELTGNAPPATSRIVDRMVTAGLLDRSVDPDDRRAVVVTLTAKAEALRHLQDFYKPVNAIMTEGFTDAETKMLSALLRRVEDNTRAATEKLR